jgi:hypothetical protein
MTNEESELLKEIKKLENEIDRDEFYDGTNGFRWGHSADKIRPLLELKQQQLENLRMRKAIKEYDKFVSKYIGPFLDKYKLIFKSFLNKD